MTTVRDALREMLALHDENEREGRLRFAKGSHVDRVVKAARAALAADDWQAIETAPRDGTDFLALCSWQKKHHQIVGCFAPSGKFVSWPGRHQGYHPTHWQPLPPPPKG